MDWMPLPAAPGAAPAAAPPLPCQPDNLFNKEKAALAFCSHYRISEDDPRRADIINAFCVGARLAQPAEPLTDKQLANIAEEDEFLLYSFNEIARAIEAAHGIRA